MNHIKSTFRLLGAALFAAALVTACYDDAAEVPIVKLGALEHEYVVEADASIFDIEIYANSDYHIERLNEADWLDLAIGEVVNDMVVITAECKFNEGFKRRADFVLCSDLDSRRDTVSIKQKALIEASLSFENASVVIPGAGGESSETVNTNVAFEDMTVVITYSDESNTDWITDLRIANDESEVCTMYITAEPNPDNDAPRAATVDISFTDGWDDSVGIDFNLLQRNAKEELGKEVTFEEFRNDYVLDKEIEDYILLSGIVVSNTTNRNAGENEQTTTSSIDYTISARTVYLESEDGKYGVSILTETEEDNVFEQYDHAQILLYGVTANLKENPDRYELSGVTRSMITQRVSGSAADVPIKERSIGSLTDDDVYTYVKLTNVEFPIRKGSITPINEGYSIGTNADRLAKYPLLVRDIYGDDMFMITNTNCLYRSDGTRLPYGSGSIYGVIVHEHFPRYDWRTGADPEDIEDDETLGYIGRYQIRHQVKEDIWKDMNDSVEDSFSALLCEYRFQNPDVTNQVLKPTYGTNGWFTHTYQTKYTGSSSKNYTQATYSQHLYGGGTYDYLGPIGDNASHYFGKNIGNKNGIGIVLDLDHESYYSGMEQFISHNPDGTVEYCGPYASSPYVGYGTGGWTGEEGVNVDQINYSGSSSMYGKGNVSGSCYVGIGNNYWWDYDTDRPYAWLINFSTVGISTSNISMQTYQLGASQNFYSPRYWCAEWAYTDSQAAEDDDQWHLIGEYTVPDVSVWANTLYSSIVAFKPVNFSLPLEILGHENVYIRLRPVNDLCSDGVEYDNAHLGDGGVANTSYLDYFAIRYNK